MVSRANMLARLGLLLVLYLGLAGCSSSSPQEPPGGGPPTVTVSFPLQREVTDQEDYTGRTAAVETVEVRARVSGYLDKIDFQEGAEVQEGDLLYEIDPRPYKAVLDQAEAQVRLQQANLKYQEAVYARNEILSRTNAIAPQELEQSRSQRDVAQAQLTAARASRAQAQLNVDFTKIRSPIAGRVSRTLVTRGNLVVADQTLLTNVVSQDPMYVYFDVDERTVLHIQELIREGKFHSVRTGARNPVYLGLANEEGYPHEGYVDFVNNQADPATATLQIRGVFANPKPPVGGRLLSPNLFVRIRVPIGLPYPALLVIADAIGTDLDLKYVYVIDDQNRAVRRNVTLGTDHEGLTVIRKGLQAGERVVVLGLQHLRPDMVVAPKLVAMPVPRKDALPRTPPAVLKNPISPQAKR